MSAARKLSYREGTSALDAQWVVDRARDLDSVERTLLNKIALRGAGYGPCWPRITELAAGTALSKSTVHAALARLRTRGLVRVVRCSRRTAHGLERRPSRLSINRDALLSLRERPRGLVEELVNHDTEETSKDSEIPSAGLPPPADGPPGPGAGAPGPAIGLFKDMERSEERTNQGGGDARTSDPPEEEFFETQGNEAEADDPGHEGDDNALAGDPDDSHELADELADRELGDPRTARGGPAAAPVVLVPLPGPREAGRPLRPECSASSLPGPGEAALDHDLSSVVASLVSGFRALWAEAHEGRVVALEARDLAAARSVAGCALAQADAWRQRGPGETRDRRELATECCSTWVRTYLARPGRITPATPQGWLASRRHPLALLPSELNSLDLPSSWRAAPAPRPAARPVAPPPTLPLPPVASLPDSDLPRPSLTGMHLVPRPGSDLRRRWDMQQEANRRALLAAVPEADRARFVALDTSIVALSPEEKQWLTAVKQAAHRAVFPDASPPPILP